MLQTQDSLNHNNNMPALPVSHQRCLGISSRRHRPSMQSERAPRVRPFKAGWLESTTSPRFVLFALLVVLLLLFSTGLKLTRLVTSDFYMRSKKEYPCGLWSMCFFIRKHAQAYRSWGPSLWVKLTNQQVHMSAMWCMLRLNLTRSSCTQLQSRRGRHQMPPIAPVYKYGTT